MSGSAGDPLLEAAWQELAGGRPGYVCSALRAILSNPSRVDSSLGMSAFLDLDACNGSEPNYANVDVAGDIVGMKWRRLAQGKKAAVAPPPIVKTVVEPPKRKPTSPLPQRPKKQRGVTVNIRNGYKNPVPRRANPELGLPHDCLSGIFGDESDDETETVAPRVGGDEPEIDRSGPLQVLSGSRVCFRVGPPPREWPCPELGARLDSRLDIDNLVDPTRRPPEKVELYAWPRFELPGSGSAATLRREGQGRSYVKISELLASHEEKRRKSERAVAAVRGEISLSEYDPFCVDPTYGPACPRPRRQRIGVGSSALTQFTKRPKKWGGLFLVPYWSESVSAPRPIVGESLTVKSLDPSVTRLGGAVVDTATELPSLLSTVLESCRGHSVFPEASLPRKATWVESGDFVALCCTASPTLKNFFLVEVSPDRKCPGRGTVKRVAPVGGPGVRIGAPITPIDFMTANRADNAVRRLAAKAHDLARGEKPQASPRAVLHHLGLCCADGIRVPPTYLKRRPDVPAPPTVTKLELSSLKAINRYQALTPAERREIPSPEELCRAWTRFCRNEGLIATSGGPSPVPVAFYEPVKPAIGEPSAGKPIVVGPTGVYKASLRSGDVTKQKRRQGRRPSDSGAPVTLESLKQAGGYDARGVKPADAARLAAEIRKRGFKSKEIDFLENLGPAGPGSKEELFQGWKKHSTDRWAAVLFYPRCDSFANPPPWKVGKHAACERLPENDPKDKQGPSFS